MSSGNDFRIKLSNPVGKSCGAEAIHDPFPPRLSHTLAGQIIAEKLNCPGGKLFVVCGRNEIAFHHFRLIHHAI